MPILAAALVQRGDGHQNSSHSQSEIQFIEKEKYDFTKVEEIQFIEKREILFAKYWLYKERKK